ncbi:hypothetical protein MGG_12739 [Pyricularia oryzae 70-15]|uniref:ERT1/acuK family PAS domain-containing protein n=1 Tax=Pyricularia oryzae (strain 70-15 / ATCC MYA-4617 / FGSC 8958) TaxID=242507 RepID=G4N9J9_PYRO7|nr:uncharacterized protein MGG_12739 [Pyricularia oryzae 70-15]EHA50391.1 hypothetical protein MGG_12739 [Pyricularia oryzae 70-15]
MALRQGGSSSSSSLSPPCSLRQAGVIREQRRLILVVIFYYQHMTCDLERPCTRCIKRNIGHLCHDEPREHESKKAKSALGTSADDSEHQTDTTQTSRDTQAAASTMAAYDGRIDAVGTGLDNGAATAVLGRGNPLLVQQSPLTGVRPNAMGSENLNSCKVPGFSDGWINQSHFHDMHGYHPSFNLITPEVTNEFNLLSDFLNGSLLEDGSLLQDEQSQTLPPGTAQADTIVSSFLNSNGENSTTMNGTENSMLPPSAIPHQKESLSTSQGELGKSIARPSSTVPIDKAREYYLQAADPSGNDTAEERMQRLLKAKYDAGLLKPFNYIKGYSRLSNYLDSHIAATSKQKILRQLDRFRPKFREKIHALTDIELVFVEMWFEKTLMDYDRVFASMAIPACCWRRTGEIFRGNKEMAELINVPVDDLRDGKIALHEILTEESVVRYWEEFGTIAFDPAHDTLLTACTLKNPDDKSELPAIKCCFSLKIRRDDHKIRNNDNDPHGQTLMSGDWIAPYQGNKLPRHEVL